MLPIAGWWHPNGVLEERTYTPRGWLNSLTIKKADGTVLDEFTYLYSDSATGTYDPTGHLRREVDAGGRTHEFFYNNRYELTGEAHPDFGTIQYQYDKNGNRTRRIAGSTTEYHGIGLNNKLAWINGTNTPPTAGQTSPYTLFSWDPNGRLATRDRRYPDGTRRIYTFLWDGDDRLRQAKEGSTTRFTATYNGAGERRYRWDSWKGDHTFSWGLGGVLQDHPGGFGTPRKYTPGLQHREGSSERFYHADWQGSTRYLSDSSGTLFPSALRFDAFGLRTAHSGAFNPTDFQYKGSWGYQTESATATNPGLGLIHVGQRYYDPAIGRFISPDPIGFAGGLNLYRYVGNNPVAFADPTGTSPLLVAGAGGALVGGIYGGVSAWAAGQDVGAGIVRGALIGGLAGVTGGAAGLGAGTLLGTGTAGSIASGMVGGVVSDVAEQGIEVALGYRCSFDAVEALGAALTGGFGAGIARRAHYSAWRRGLPFKPGDIIFKEYETSRGILDVAAEVAIEGRTLILNHIAVFPRGAARFDLGTGQVLRLLRRQVAPEVRGMGFTGLRIRGIRHSGATENREAELFLDLTK